MFKHTHTNPRLQAGKPPPLRAGLGLERPPGTISPENVSSAGRTLSDVSPRKEVHLPQPRPPGRARRARSALRRTGSQVLPSPAHAQAEVKNHPGFERQRPVRPGARAVSRFGR